MEQLRKFKGGTVRMNIDQLKDIELAMLRKYKARVGILGKKNARTPKEGEKTAPLTNAEIGAVHEFGCLSKNIPARSFLRMPIFQNLAKSLDTGIKQGIFNDITRAKIRQAYQRLGTLGEQVVQMAFAQSGPGWAPLKHREGKPLIDTGALRRSIMSEVVG